MSGSATTLASTATTAAAAVLVEDLRFGLTDYTIFVVMLSISAAIGVYFGFYSKSKNTTEEYLHGGKRMQALPIAISLVSRFVDPVSESVLISLSQFHYHRHCH